MPSNRFEGYVSKQRYDKPNRGAGPGLTQDSNSKELDTFVISQLAYNRVLSPRMFMDAKISYNNTHFPLFQKTDLQPLTDSSNNNALYRNRQSSQIMYRRRLQAIANWQYYQPNLLWGRHEFKGGFDNGYTPENVDTLRVDDVNLVYPQRAGAGGHVGDHLQHSAAPGARRHEHGALRAGLGTRAAASMSPAASAGNGSKATCRRSRRRRAGSSPTVCCSRASPSTVSCRTTP